MDIIYYDVTHLIGWQGGLTGIPRTTDEIARRLRADKNVIFITWDKRSSDFKKVDIDRYYTEVEPANRHFYKSRGNTVELVDPRMTRYVRRILTELPLLGRAAAKIKRHYNLIINNGPSPSIVGKSISPQKGDVIFTPCGLWDDDDYMSYFEKSKKEGVKLAFVCYDLLPIVVPQFSGQWGGPMEEFTKRVTSICDIVFSISEHTKRDLLSWLKANKLKQPEVRVIKLGDDFKFSKPAKPNDRKFVSTGIGKPNEPFILCTGTIEARKNHTLLYYTYKLAKSRGIELPRLIVVGRRGHRTENIIDIIQDDPGVNDKITLLFDTNDQELAWLYRHCRFTIYPSFYEGWGLPIAESIANGVPCISSNTSSMTEVAKGFVDYFDPTSPEDCLRAITEYMEPAKYKAVKQRAQKYKQVTWDETYQEVANGLDKIVKGH